MVALMSWYVSIAQPLAITFVFFHNFFHMNTPVVELALRTAIKYVSTFEFHVTAFHFDIHSLRHSLIGISLLIGTDPNIHVFLFKLF